jgi:hypothetical protein
VEEDELVLLEAALEAEAETLVRGIALLAEGE